jgi:hypothetical protein
MQAETILCHAAGPAYHFAYDNAAGTPHGGMNAGPGAKAKVI